MFMERHLPKEAGQQTSVPLPLQLDRGPLEGPMGSPAPARVARALEEPRAPTWLGGGEGKGRSAEGVGPSHRQQGNGQQGKGFGAKTVTYRTAGEAAEKGERDQDAGGKPGRGRDADRRRMGSERHCVRRGRH